MQRPTKLRAAIPAFVSRETCLKNIPWLLLVATMVTLLVAQHIELAAKEVEILHKLEQIRANVAADMARQVVETKSVLTTMKDNVANYGTRLTQLEKEHANDFNALNSRLAESEAHIRKTLVDPLDDFGASPGHEFVRLTDFHRSFISSYGLPHVAVALRPDDAVLDIGANLGVYVDQVRVACPRCSIFAFEVMPRYARFVRDRLAKDPLVTVFPVGLSDVSGNGTMFYHPVNLGWNTMVAEKATDDMIRVGVNFVKLDDIPKRRLPPLQRIKLIKIDTEGAEWRVIEGGKQFLDALPRPKPHIQLEIAWGKHHPSWDKELAAFEWLMTHGWKRQVIRDDATYDTVFEPE